MDFFDREAHARKKTRRLVWLLSLTLLVALVVNNLLLDSLVACFAHPLSMPIIIVTAYYLAGELLVHPQHFASLVFHWQPMLWVSLGTLASVAGGSLYKIRQLSKGGGVVADFLGGRRLDANPDDPGEQQLRHVVEEMAIASGMPVPEIYVLDCERGINTFAAGHTLDDVAIGVTRGCIMLLTRDELQGVIAHEFSHILNGDTRLNMKLIGLVHGFFWPTLLGRILIYGRMDGAVFEARGRGQMLPTAPLGCLLAFMGCFSLPFVRLVKSAICREREWLADAAAVQFTRNPQGIAGALTKIGGLSKQGRLDTPHAEVASHLYFANSDYDPWVGFLATHPPLAKRISAIDPQFNGSFPKVQMLAPNQAERDEIFARTICEARAAGGAFYNMAVEVTGITSEHLRQASLIRSALPDEIKNAMRTPGGAANIIFSLVLGDGDDDSMRVRQMEILQSNLAPATFAQFRSLEPQVESLDEKYKLPLAEFSVPALRDGDAAAYQSFNQLLQRLLDCNSSIDLFEYTLTKIVIRQLGAHFDGPNLSRPMGGRAKDVLPECALLLSALAHVGNENEARARNAFERGADYLDRDGEQIEFLPRSEWDLAGVDAALTKLAGYHEPLRRNVLLACGKTVTADNRVTIREAELIRAIADTLDCPMPPFVEAIE